jgi:hypothetical protein
LGQLFDGGFKPAWRTLKIVKTAGFSLELFFFGFRKTSLTRRDVRALLLLPEALLFGENERWKH